MFADRGRCWGYADAAVLGRRCKTWISTAAGAKTLRSWGTQKPSKTHWPSIWSFRGPWPSLQGVGECGRPQGRQVMQLTDLPPDIALCTCAKSGGRTSHSKFQVEVLRTLTKGAKISSDFQAQSCHCHVTISSCWCPQHVTLAGSCYCCGSVGRPKEWVILGGTRWNMNQGVVGVSPQPWRSCCMNNPSFPMLGASWCYVWKQLGWGSLNGQR